MGQYRQWLHFREVDQRLRTQLGLLSQDLIELQAQVAHFEEHADLYEENSIIQALTAYFATKASSHGPVEHEDTTPDVALQPSVSISQTPELETVSPALFGWSHLPNLGLQDIHDQEQQQVPSLPLVPTVPAPRPRIDLLPDETRSFFNEHGETGPQLTLPWWLHNVLTSPTGVEGNGLIDQQSLRTNRLVQRWLERWRTGDDPVEQDISREEQQS